MKPSAMIGIAGLVAGALWLGRSSAPSAGPAPAAQSADVDSPAVAARPAPAFDRQVPRVEPRAALAAAPPIAAAAEEPEPPTEAEAQARDAALELIAAASGRRQWTADDWMQLDELLGAMAPAERHGALEELAATINDGGMTLEPHP